MRIRSTKPEFWRSETIASLDWEARLVLKGIESYVDDNGVGKDSEVIICADVFPHDLARDRETLARVSRGLQALCDADLIVRYTMRGERLLYVRNWKSLQRVDRPNKGRYPRPDGTLDYTEDVDESICAGSGSIAEAAPRHPRETLATPSRDMQETPSTGTEDQGSSGSVEKTCPSAAPPDGSSDAVVASSPRSTRRRGGDDPPGFAAFWEIYPRKESRKAAVAAFVKAMKITDLETILSGVGNYIEATRDRNPRRVAHGATWLNQERWNDEPLPAWSEAGRGKSGEAAAQSVHEMAAELDLEAEYQENSE